MKNFTFNYIRGQYEAALIAGYNILSISEFIEGSLDNQMTIVNRIDIDESCSKAEKIAQIFNKLNKRNFFCKTTCKGVQSILIGELQDT